MGTIAQLKSALKSLDIQRVASEAVDESKDSILDLNVMQMNRGLRADGSFISPSYSPMTVEIKKAKGQPYDRVTLRDTGEFQREIYAIVQGIKIDIGSRNWKESKIEKKYSKARGSIFGLSEKYANTYIEDDLRPIFNKKISDVTGLKF